MQGIREGTTIGLIEGNSRTLNPIMGLIKRDTRSLDYGPFDGIDFGMLTWIGLKPSIPLYLDIDICSGAHVHERRSML